MIYQWRCDECSGLVEVQRSVADRTVPPVMGECDHFCTDHKLCISRSFTRVISPPLMTLVHENEAQYFD